MLQARGSPVAHQALQQGGHTLQRHRAVRVARQALQQVGHALRRHRSWKSRLGVGPSCTALRKSGLSIIFDAQVSVKCRTLTGISLSGTVRVTGFIDTQAIMSVPTVAPSGGSADSALADSADWQW